MTTTTDEHRRAAIERQVQRTSDDPSGSHAIYHDDAVLEFPQSGERFEGVANFREWRAQYPAAVEFQVRRITGSGDVWVRELSVRYDGGPWMLGVAVLEFRDDRIARERIYVTEPWPAPAWRAKWRSATDGLSTPMPLHASWVHGNALTIETPQNVRTHLPQGSGTTVDLAPGTGTWLHIAIPTPVIVRDVRVRAQRFFLLMSMASEPTVTDVHIYNGFNRIHAEEPSLRGDHNTITLSNTFTPFPPRVVQLGTSISFHVQTTDSVHGGHLFTVFSAGADFTT